MAREGKYVVRPDSGDPVLILCGDPTAPFGTAEYMGLIECLWNTFGGIVTSKGFKLLDSHIGAIYGDSITLDRQKRILQGLMDKGFASTNIVLGIGSFTYQMVTRDTLGWAIKATYNVINGVGVNIFKKPKTDNGTKNSAKGLIFVSVGDDGRLIAEEEVSWEKFISDENLLKVVYRNGKPSVPPQTFDEIRKRVADGAKKPELVGA